MAWGGQEKAPEEGGLNWTQRDLVEGSVVRISCEQRRGA